MRTPDGWRLRIRDATRLRSQTTPMDGEPLLIDRAPPRSRGVRPDRGCAEDRRLDDWAYRSGYADKMLSMGEVACAAIRTLF
jgi:hypothetical protein